MTAQGGVVGHATQGGTPDEQATLLMGQYPQRSDNVFAVLHAGWNQGLSLAAMGRRGIRVHRHEYAGRGEAIHPGDWPYEYNSVRWSFPVGLTGSNPALCHFGRSRYE